MPELSAFEVEMATEKLKDTNHQGLTKSQQNWLMQGVKTIHPEIHTLIISIWRKKEVPEAWKELNIVPIHKKCDKVYCIYYRGISLLSTTYKILPNILLSKLTPYAEEIIGFQCNRSITGYIFCNCQILEKKMGIKWSNASLFTDFKKAYDLVWRQVLYTILIEFGITMKLGRVMKPLGEPG